MNSFRKHIRKKLLGYEPEVNSALLNQSWAKTKELLEKKSQGLHQLKDHEPEVTNDTLNDKWQAIVPYLPKEKKKRIVVYLPTGCAFQGFLLLIAVAGLIFGLKYRHNHHSHTHAAITAISREHAQPISNNSTRSHAAYDKPIKAASATNKKTIPSRSFTAASKYSTLSGYNTKAHESSYINATQQTLSDSMPLYSFYFINPLLCLPDKTLNDSLLKSGITNPSMQQKKVSRFSMDIAPGIAYLNNIVTFNDQKTQQQHTGTVSLTAALNYRAGRHLSLFINGILVRNFLNERNVRDYNFIISKSPVSTSGTAGSSDSTITCLSFKQEQQLRSVFSWQAGAGASVKFFEKQRVSLESFVAFQLHTTRLIYTYSYQAQDTITYTKSSSQLPFQNISDKSQAESSETRILKTNYAIYSGFILSCKMNQYLSVIIKPGISFDLKQVKTTPVNYRQYHVALNAGVRYTF